MKKKVKKIAAKTKKHPTPRPEDSEVIADQKAATENEEARRNREAVMHKQVDNR